MADVAREMGVSPGNLYNYVDSKDALFYLVLRRMLGERAGHQPVVLPVTGASVPVTAHHIGDLGDLAVGLLADLPHLECQQRGDVEQKRGAFLGGGLRPVGERLARRGDRRVNVLAWVARAAPPASAALGKAHARYARTIPTALAKITKAVKARDADAARASMLDHIAQWARLNPDVSDLESIA